MSSGNIASCLVLKESGSIGLLRSPASPMSVKLSPLELENPAIVLWTKMDWVMLNSTANTRTGMVTTSRTRWSLVYELKQPITLKEMKDKHGFKPAPRGLVYLPRSISTIVNWKQQKLVRDLNLSFRLIFS